MRRNTLDERPQDLEPATETGVSPEGLAPTPAGVVTVSRRVFGKALTVRGVERKTQQEDGEKRNHDRMLPTEVDLQRPLQDARAEAARWLQEVGFELLTEKESEEVVAETAVTILRRWIAIIRDTIPDEKDHEAIDALSRRFENMVAVGEDFAGVMKALLIDSNGELRRLAGFAMKEAPLYLEMARKLEAQSSLARRTA